MFAPGGRIVLREITASELDTDLIVYWRNTRTARDSFFSKEVVTPDTHRKFIAGRRPHDLIWMIVVADAPIGVVALTVDVEDHAAEFGRLFIDESARGQEFGQEAVCTTLLYAFGMLRLDQVYADVYTSNAHALDLYSEVGFAGFPDAQRQIVRLVYTDALWKKRCNEFYEKYGWANAKCLLEKSDE